MQVAAPYAPTPMGQAAMARDVLNNLPAMAQQYVQSQNNPAQPAPAPSSSNTGSVLGTSTTGGTGAGTASSSSIPPAQYTALVGGVQNLINQAISGYNALIGSYGNAVQNQENTLQQSAKDQQDQLTTQYQYAAPQLQAMENARGIGDSSWAYREQQNAGNTYGQQMQQIGDQLNNNLTNLGGTAAGNLNQWNADKGWLQNINLGQYPANDLGYYSLQNLQNDVLLPKISTIAGLQGSAQPGGQLLGQVQSIAPSQVYNPQAIQSQLNALSQSSAPKSALNQVASAAINAGNYTPQTQLDLLNGWQKLIS